jgi:predicted metal-dependent hydrolase
MSIKIIPVGVRDVEPGTQNTERETPEALFAAGVDLFNRGEYFDAHEVWEDLWMDCPATERRFVQALIQAAVALYHFGRNNSAGAARLFHSGRRYMEPYRPVHRGLDIDAFWRQMEAHLAPALTNGAAPVAPRPIIVLDPEAGDV